MAGVLDSARFSLFLAREAGVSVKDVRAMVLGGHGDDMVPVLSMTHHQRRPRDARSSPRTSSTRSSSAPARAAARLSRSWARARTTRRRRAAVAMAEAYLLDQKRLLPCAAYLDGEYGYKDLFMGVPCVVGGKGVEKIVELPLTDEEKAHAHEERRERSGHRRRREEELRVVGVSVPRWRHRGYDARAVTRRHPSSGASAATRRPSKRRETPCFTGEGARHAAREARGHDDDEARARRSDSLGGWDPVPSKTASTDTNTPQDWTNTAGIRGPYYSAKFFGLIP